MLLPLQPLVAVRDDPPHLRSRKRGRWKFPCSGAATRALHAHVLSFQRQRLVKPGGIGFIISYLWRWHGQSDSCSLPLDVAVTAAHFLWTSLVVAGRARAAVTRTRPRLQ
jgi:hypothetical protein